MSFGFVNKLVLVNRNIDRALNLAADFPDLDIACKGLNELDVNIFCMFFRIKKLFVINLLFFK